MPPGGLHFLSRQEMEERSRVKGCCRAQRIFYMMPAGGRHTTTNARAKAPPCKPPPPIRECVKKFDKKLTHDRKCAPGEVQGGGGFDCGSNQLNAPPKPTSLVTFLFGDKKVTRPYPAAGSSIPETMRSISLPPCPCAYSTFCISCRCRRGRDRWGLPSYPCGQAAASRCRRGCRWQRSPWPPFGA